MLLAMANGGTMGNSLFSNVSTLAIFSRFELSLTRLGLRCFAVRALATRF